jgi:hypothetical protein
MRPPLTNRIESGSSNSGKIAITVGIALAIGAFFYFDLGRFLSLAALKENRDSLLAFTEANFAAAMGIFVVAYAMVTGLSLPGRRILVWCRIGDVVGEYRCDDRSDSRLSRRAVFAERYGRTEVR